MIDFSKESLYKELINRPHVCILGAGATMAAIPNGDYYGRKSSVMNNLIDNLGLTNIIEKAKIKITSNNFEEIYSELHSRDDCYLLRIVLENKVKNFFSSLRIPDTPTVYDYIIASLRGKDYIFSFNWDPLIIQAYNRVAKLTSDLPALAFLHGNVWMKSCSDCHCVQSIFNTHCIDCQSTNFDGPQILFPIKNKDYTSSPYLKAAWEDFLNVIAGCTYLTVFGYSAPKSDKNAIEAMQLAFDSNFRRFDNIEIIDIAPFNDVYDSWAPFIHSTNDHYKIVNSFWESSFVEFPRRTIEGYCKRNIMVWFGPSHMQLHECNNFNEFNQLFLPIIAEEKKGNFDTL